MIRKPAPVVLEFSDNGFLARLAGPGQKHFVRIEHKLDVRIETRGNLVAIEGEGRQAAARVLRRSYERLAAGEAVGTADLDSEIRFASEETGAASGGLKTAGGKLIRPRTPTQSAYLSAMTAGTLTFGVGPAGTGKTFLAAAFGASLLLRKQVDRLILSRPAIEAGERLGFLPGDMKEKVDPYLRPLYDALFDTMGEACNKFMEQGKIEVAPLAFMRGRTLARAFVILDEAQNCTAMQMKMILTRLGEESYMVVTGDASQSDLPGGRAEGLNEALALLDGVEGVNVVRFAERDVVRHPLVARIVAAYAAADEKKVRAKRP